MEQPISQFDPNKYKETTHNQWQAAAEAWYNWSDVPHKWLGKATDKMLEMAEVVDVVISRVGLIYFPNQQKALREMWRALKPSGKVAAIVYSTAKKTSFSLFRFPLFAIGQNYRLRYQVNLGLLV